MTRLKRTPLFDLHAELGAKMVPFAGYEMPVQYPMGVMKEHLHTRGRAGLFDVSHMGQVLLSGPSWDAVALAFEALVPVDVLGLADGRQRYGFFTNDAGGIEDDLMFSRRGDALFVVINAGCKDADLALMRAGLPDDITLTELSDRALLALQGPAAGSVIASLDARAAAMRFMDTCELSLCGHTVWASRSGYTGEDGFEISVHADEAVALAQRLVEDAEVAPIGLGARDSLRLEAGLCLYGNDIDAATGPVGAGLSWAIQKVRRPGGARAGGFPGSKAIFDEIAQGPATKRVGLRPEGRAPMRQGVALFASAEGGAQIGSVTSGGFGPSVQGPVAMGYVDTDFATTGTALWGEVRSKRMGLKVVDLPFVPAGFKR
ncbi:glycine cleavage system protein T [Roseobacter denitrificans]|uniref:aminomethyltransferase n=1 Tax=Roseobacter denitrificans (strain ATCC 33942 / OCh 114) TaxID=375451 RepID=Q16AX2_ROSDO|nr:glycine cleavage system aminomethyltransferase GcvT [Roseobacter denitrificans]ABG30871.1 aminomethyltransferase [Roseobacter denitrificans OCh 114]AVL53969.1 glycine cleavage system protein T [Roseobacter denitrificans]SFG14899.1 aminomethyltransferase [Roseobacter denitrificans OCh 114]